MKDYDIWYAGMVIGNLKSETDRKALNLAKKMFRAGKLGSIAVSSCSANQEQINKAKADSLIKPEHA